MQQKNSTNSWLAPAYEERIFRKLKWNNTINEKRSEDVMMRKFRKKFGEPDQIVIGYGDFSEKKQMRFKPPSKGNGIRKLFSRHGYTNVFEVDEFRTSILCSKCNLKMTKPTMTKTINGIETAVGIYKLFNCTNCNIFWNRDINACLNIHDIVVSELYHSTRPPNLQRPIQEEDEDEQ